MIPYPVNRYRPTRISDGEGGYTEQLNPPVVVFAFIETNKAEISMIVDMYEDVKVGDLIGVTPEDAIAEALYRVQGFTRILSTTKREVALERVDRPITPNS